MPTYPYTSGQGAIAQAFAQLRRGFPPKVDAGYLQRFGIAPANESYIIAILRHLGLIDEEGSRDDDNTKFFFGGDDDFKSGLESRLRETYSQLFSEMGEEALTAERDALTNWFRAADKTSALVGQRQASTFLTLAALAGHGDVPTSRSGSSSKGAAASAGRAKASRASATGSPNPKASAEKASKSSAGVGPGPHSEMGLTVRIEVNLPPGGDTNTYDAIFASIKKHLMS